MALRRATLRSLRERAEGRRIALRGKVLVTALLVGLCHSFIPSVATPLTLSVEQRAQVFPKQYAAALVMTQWKSKREYNCLEQLWERESHWNPKAHNKSSGAFGIAQFLPRTWGNYKYPYKPKAATIQITAGLRYITKRYDTPCKAWEFWQKQARKGNAWY